MPLRYGERAVTVRGRVTFRSLLGSFDVAADPAPPELTVSALPGRLPGVFLVAPEGVTVLGRDGEPFARFTADGVEVNVLPQPTGEVIAFSGADRDEVVAPGSGTPVTTPEIFDPKTGQWTELASQSKGRTYHNSVTLLPDGRVLVGGHAPITTGYGKSTDLLEKTLGFSNPNRDPSFEIFSPPNLFYGPRPVITAVDTSLDRGRTLDIATPDAAEVSSVTLLRNTAMTHLVDSDQRTVVLPVVSRGQGRVTVAVTDNAAVLPDGPYTVVVNKQYEQGETPSVGRQVFVGEVPAQLADDIARNNAATLGEELAARAQGAAARPASAPASPPRGGDTSSGDDGLPAAPAALVGGALVLGRSWAARG